MDSSWTTYLARLPKQHPVRRAILESWRRSAAAGLTRDGEPVFRRVAESNLRDRQQEAAQFIAVAAPMLDELIARLPGSTNVAYITDGDGIVLHSTGDPATIATFGLSPGHDWSEQTMGTNGAGTCLRVARPIVVQGSQHFKTAFENCTCTACPVRGAGGEIIGALDVSSSVADADFRRIAVVASMADAIEEALRLGDVPALATSVMVERHGDRHADRHGD